MTQPLFVDPEGRALLVRAEAVRRLIRCEPGLDRMLLFSYVVWPTEKMLAMGAPVQRSTLPRAELLRRQRIENRASYRRRKAA